MTLDDHKLHTAIDRFIVTDDSWHTRNAWLKGRYSEIYVRRDSYRILAGRSFRTLDLATLNVQRAYQGRGILTNLLAFLEAKHRVLFVENVLEPRLCVYFERRGYQRHTMLTDYPRSYFFIPETLKHQTADTESAPIPSAK